MVPATYPVTSVVDSLAAGTLRSAIASVNGDTPGNNDIIDFSGISGQTITLTMGSLELTNASLASVSIEGASAITISGDNSSQVFVVDGGVNATFSGLTIQDGLGANGGGVNNAGTLTLNDCQINNSSGTVFGGGIYNSSTGTMAVVDSTICDNNAYSSGDGGGGIYNVGLLTISETTISGNRVSYYGAGIDNQGTLTVSYSCLSNNEASGDGEGGAIYNYGTVTVTECTISGNSATLLGSGIDNDGTLTVSDSTISGNSGVVPSNGGGIYSSTTFTLANSIVANNVADTDNDIDGTALCTYDLVGDDAGLSTVTGSTGNQLGTGGSPINPDLGPLQNNGGPTDTMALLAGSPAIGGGGEITTLNGNITSGALSITVTDGAAIACTAGQYYIMIGGEEMEVTAVSGNVLTVSRGFNGTTAASHSTGVAIYPAIDQRGNSWAEPPDIGAYAYIPGWQQTNDPTNTFGVPIGEATVMPGSGTVTVAQPLDFDVSPGTNVGLNPSLTYNSGTVSVQPIIQVDIPTNSALGVPSHIKLTLTWNGTSGSAITYSLPGGAASGDTYLLGVQVPSVVSASGEYPWEVDAEIDYTAGVAYDSAVGQASVVDQDSSPFGAGWGIAGIDSLLLTGGGVLWMTGTGASRFYSEESASGSTVTYGNSEDFGTLVETGSGLTATFQYTAPDQTKTNFIETNGSTLLFEQASIVTPDGLTTSYSHSIGDLLTQVHSSDGGNTTLSYSSGMLTSILEPGSRTVSLAYSGNDMTLLTDEAGNQRTFSYDGAGHMTLDKWSPYTTTYSYDSTSGLLDEVNQGDGVTFSVEPQAAQGLHTSAIVYSNEDTASITDALGDVTEYGLDSRGREILQVTPLGGSEIWDLDGSGLVTVSVDDHGLSTIYGYDSSGDLTEELDPDGGTSEYQYDGTFHEVTQEIDYPADGRASTTSNTYDGTTGDLLTTVTDPGTGAAATTTYAWSGGMLTHTTDPDGNATTNSYDSNHRLTLAVEYNASTVEVNYQSYTYDSAGNPLNTTTAAGYTVDSYSKTNELLTETVYTSGTTTEVQYSASTYLPAGQVATSTDGDANVTSYTYTQAGMNSKVEVLDSGSNVISDVTYAYDLADRLTLQTDAVTTGTSYGYDADGNVTLQETYDAGGTMVYESESTYDDEDDLLTTTDGDGNSTTYAYNGQGLVTQQATFDDGVTTPISLEAMGYDSHQDLTRQVDGDGNTTLYTFDSHEHMITEVLDNSGGTPISTQTWQYSSTGDMTQFIDADGGTTSYGYDGDGRITQTSGNAAISSTQAYDKMGNITESIDGDSNTTYSDYSDNLLVMQIVGSDITTYGYDLAQQQTLLIDPDGNTTLSSYDAAGDLVRQVVKNDVGSPFSTVQNAYDLAGNETSTVNLDGTTTDSAYDGGQLTLETVYDGSMAHNVLGQESWTYDKAGNVVSSIDAQGYTTTSLYDGGQVTQQEVYQGTVLMDNETTEFDLAGNVTYTEDFDGNVTLADFDGDGHMVSQEIELGGTSVINTETWAYDGNGNLLSDEVTFTTNGGSQTTGTSYGYDSSGNMNVEIDAYGTTLAATTIHDYDADSRLTTVIDPDNYTTEFAYDPRGNETWTQNAMGYTSTMAYDGNNNVTRSVDADGRTSTYAYNALGEVTTEIWQASAQTIINTYDDNGNLLTAGNGAGSYTLGYNPLGQVTRVVEPVGVTLTMGYDGDGNRTLLQDSTGGTIASTYDIDHELTTEIYSQTGVTAGLEIDEAYDWLGRVVGQTRSSGGTTAAVSDYTYNGDGQLTDLEEVNGASTLIGNYTMGYDGDGQLTQQTDHGTLSVYAYDQLGQLTSGGGTAQTYDVNGNRTGDTVTAGNEVTYDGNFTYAYDQEGNETLAYSTASSITWSYYYDSDNHMTLADEDVSGTFAMEAVYTYDAFGNMIKEVSFTGGGSPTTTTLEFVEDGWNPAKSGATGQSGWNVIADLNGSGSLATHYVWGDDVDQLFGRYDAGGTLTTDPAGIYATMNDPNGSVRDIVSGSGTLIASVPYDAFGNMLTVTSPGGAVLDPLDYVGRYTYDTYDFDAATKLYDIRDRVYDPATGRWLSQDPMGFDAGDSNLYRYVNNRPTEATDPSGLRIVVVVNRIGTASGPKGHVTVYVTNNDYSEAYQYDGAGPGRLPKATIQAVFGTKDAYLENWEPTVKKVLNLKDILSKTENNDMFEVSDGDFAKEKLALDTAKKHTLQIPVYNTAFLNSNTWAHAMLNNANKLVKVDLSKVSDKIVAWKIPENWGYGGKYFDNFGQPTKALDEMIKQAVSSRPSSLEPDKEQAKNVAIRFKGILETRAKTMLPAFPTEQEFLDMLNK